MAQESFPGPSVGARGGWLALLLGIGILWRMACIPFSELWGDWVVIVGLYWIYSLWGSRSRLWPLVTTGVLAFLLGIYVHGQIGFTLSALGLAR